MSNPPEPKAVTSSTGNEAPSQTSNDSIIQALSYFRTDFGQLPSSLFVGPRPEHSVELSLIEPFPATAIADLGSLSSLSPELMRMILDHLPVGSWLHLRNVNRLMRKFVTSVPDYSAVVTHGLHCLKTVLSSGLDGQFSFPQLSLLLRQQNCYGCGDFAGFIYLLRPGRYCMNCLLNSAPTPEEFDPDRVSDCYTISLLRFATFTRIPTKTLCDRLTVMRIRCNRRERDRTGTLLMPLVNFNKAVEVARGLRGHDSLALGMALLNNMLTGEPSEDHKILWSAAAALPVYDPQTSTPFPGLACRGCAPHPELPPLDKEFEEDGRRLYTRDQLLEHVKTCDPAQELRYLAQQCPSIETFAFWMLYRA